MKKEERVKRVIARGEISGHAHIVTGECEITKENESVFIKAGKNCAIKHLLEIPFIEEGVEKWTGEHKDIIIPEGESYEFIQQVEYNPYENAIRSVKD